MVRDTQPKEHTYASINMAPGTRLGEFTALGAMPTLAWACLLYLGPWRYTAAAKK